MRNTHEIAGSSSRLPTGSPSPIYRVGETVIDPGRGYFRRAGNDDLYLRPQTFQVLVYLLAHRDRVVGKEELRREIWGDIAVTDDAFVQCVVDIRRALGDDSREQRFVKTVSRIGYRFVGPVEVEDHIEAVAPRHAPTGEPLAELSVVPPRAKFRVRHVLLLGIAAVVTVAVVSTLWQQRSQTSPATALTAAPGVRRIVVFYFENQSGSREYDWLRHGLADMVITGLSRSADVAVLSRQQLEVLLDRNGVETTRAPALDRALTLAQQSGADSIVMGSFGEIGGAIRFEARIHDARDGRLIGVEAAVSQSDQLLTDSDLVSLRVAARLGVDVRAKGAGTLPEVTTSSLEAYRFYLMGLEKGEQLDTAEAIRLFETALKLDPQFAMASARIGYAYAVTQSMPDRAKPYLQKAFENPSRLSDKDRLYIMVWSALSNLDYAQAISHLNDIVRQYPLEAEAWWRLGTILNSESRPDEARVALQRGLVADPFNRQMVNTLGMVYQTLRQPDEAIAMHRRYTELSPQEANAFDSLGLSYQFAGRYADAIAAYQRALALDPSFEIAAVHLGNTYYQLGRFKDAIAEYRRYINASDYGRDRGRGHAQIAWVEWRRSSRAAVEKERALARASSDLLHLEFFLIDLDRGRPADAKQQLQSLAQSGNRGRRLSRRIELYAQGEVAMREDRSDDAIALFKDAVKQPPIPWGIESYEDCLASALLRLRRFDEAAAEYRRLLTLNPNFAHARYGLARALDQSGHSEEAAREYERFLEIWRDADDDVPDLIDARKRLAALSTNTR